MNKIFKNEKGFSAVEVLLVILILFVIGGIGYMVYHNDRKTKITNSTTASVNKTSSSLPTSSITSGPNNEWKTYTNNVLGFSFTIPATSYNPNGCSQRDTYSGGSSTITGPETYQTTAGPVPNTVINVNGTYYVAPTYTYVLTGGTTPTIDGVDGYDVFSGCQKETTSPTLISQQLSDESQVNGPTNIDTAMLSVKAQKVAQGAALDTAIQNIFGDKTLHVTSLSTNTHGGGGDILNLTCSQNPCANTGGGYYLLYYPSKNLLTFWNTGQACNLSASSANNATCYDSSVIDSFKLVD
jgi:hypothetical protein